MGWGAILQQIDRDHATATATARQTAAHLARAFEARLTDRIARIDETILHTRETLVRGPGLVPGRLSTFHSHFADFALVEVAVIDAEGRLLDSTLPHTRGEDLKNQEYVRVYRNASTGRGGDRLFISKPVLSQVPERWSVQFTRRIDGPDGKFAGVLVFSINPFVFGELADDLPLGERGGVLIVGNDRVVRMLHARRDDAAWRDRIGWELPADRPCFDPSRPAADVVYVFSAARSGMIYAA